MMEHVHWLDQLNLRASYGIQGNVVNTLSNELLSGQRLTVNAYQQKAEENLMKILNEKQINQRRLVWTAVIDVIYIAIAFFIAWIAAWVEMHQAARVALMVIALLVSVLGIVFVSVVDTESDRKSVV